MPDGLLSYSVAGPLVVPHFLGEHDLPWLRVLIEEHERFIGRPHRELEARLREPLPCEIPPGKLRLAIQVLARSQQNVPNRSAVPPRNARALVFETAALTGSPPPVVLSRVAADLRVTPRDLEDSLFADLPGERLVAGVPASANNLALRVNLAVVQGLLSHASRVRIDAEGNARSLVRHARLRGLICTVAERSAEGAARLEISGPFSLFRRTRLYGQALGEIIPMLAWCARFRLHADCHLRGRRLVLQLRTGDPVFPGSPPRRHDSRIEERFAREFRRVAPEWDIVREPEPIQADGSVIFPDFALQCRANPAHRWLLEIVGFWTPDYLARKLARYRSARLSNLILCIDDARNCTHADLPADAHVIRFHRRVDPTAVLRVLAT